MPPEFRPTGEQEAAVAAFRGGGHLVLQAGAGSGKTTTLRMLAASTTRRGRYIAFNKPIAQHAKQTFPNTVRCGTAHGLAYAAVGHRYNDRLDAPRVSGTKLAQQLAIRSDVQLGHRIITPRGLCYAAQETVVRYCQFDATTISANHVPWLKGITDRSQHAELAEAVLPLARTVWADLQDPAGGRVKFNPDHYLKMWALTEPTLHYDFLLLDEAQDTNPVVEQVFNAQRDRAQLIMVGDSAQAVYGWRGARDIMTGFAGTELALSHSFRFGAPLAEEANRWLGIAEAPIRLTGSPTVHSTVTKVSDPDAILCRTNGGAMAELLTQLENGRRVALVGKGETLASLARAAHDLKNGRRATHPELMLFASWGEVQDYAEHDRDGRDLLPLVDVIDEHGVDVVLDVISRLTQEATAEVTVSTVHKAKGREWSAVRLADDFELVEPLDPDNLDNCGEPAPGTIDLDEARLAYVAVTRAQHRLDLGGLSWVNRHPDGNPTPLST